MPHVIERHKAYMESCLKRQEKHDFKRLYRYHESRMRDFQHERLIHLLVTMLVCLITIILTGVAMVSHEILLLPVVGILLLLTFAYLLHYRKLENGVQSLYVITEELGKYYFEES